MFANKERFPDADRVIVDDFGADRASLAALATCALLARSRA